MWRETQALLPGRDKRIGPGTTAQFIVQPAIAITAETVKLASNPTSERASPPTREPSEMPRKRALLFQACMVARRAGKSLARPAC